MGDEEKGYGEYRARLAARGFKQTQGKSFVHHNISSPVVHDIMVQIVLVLMLMGNMVAHLVDVNGIFVGPIQAQQEDLLENPTWIRKFLSKQWIVVFKKDIVWCQNTTKAFWRLLLGIMNELGNSKNCADPCLYYQWQADHSLIVWLSLIYDMLIICHEQAMDDIKKQFTDTVDCDNIGEMHEFIGTRIDIF